MSVYTENKQKKNTCAHAHTQHTIRINIHSPNYVLKL